MLPEPLKFAFRLLLRPYSKLLPGYLVFGVANIQNYLCTLPGHGNASCYDNAPCNDYLCNYAANALRVMGYLRSGLVFALGA